MASGSEDPKTSTRPQSATSGTQYDDKDVVDVVELAALEVGGFDPGAGAGSGEGPSPSAAGASAAEGR